MAKGNALLGTLRGSIGDVTFSRVDGKQISRAKATTVKNPRTSKQIYQRMFFATICKAKAAMKEIVDHSFENVQRGQKSLSYFQKVNTAIMREKAHFDPIAQEWIAPAFSYVTPKFSSFPANTYRVSQGSMPVVNDMATFLHNSDGLPTGVDYWNLMPWPQKFDAAVWTEAELFDSLVRQYNLRDGDFITAVLITAKEADINMGAGYEYPCYFHFVRCKVVGYYAKLEDEDALTHHYAIVPSNIDGVNIILPNNIGETKAGAASALYGQLAANGENIKPQLSLIEGTWHKDLLTFTKPGESEPTIILSPFTAPLSKEDHVLAGTWIISRPEGEKLRVSTQDMVLADPTGDIYDLNFGLSEAYDEWLANVKPVGDDTYILEGGNK